MHQYIASFALAASLATAAVADPAAYTPLTFDAPHHGREVLAAVWYPNGGGGREFMFADNPVFHGMTVVEEARIQSGSFPVIALSHGMGGNIRSLAWLSSALAERGAIVISMNHPNTTWGDFDLAKGMNHWTRAQDLSAALDALVADPRFGEHIDTSRIMAAGFSYGGWTALSMGGARGNLAGYLDNCDIHRATSPHCDELANSADPLANAAAWNGSYSDPRITHVVAIDPGNVWGLSADDVAGMVANVSLIALGDGEHRLEATDFDASGLIDLVPDARVDRIARAIHFSALPLCKPMAEAILIEEQDDPVCTDPEGANRAEIHDFIIDRIAADLGL